MSSLPPYSELKSYIVSKDKKKKFILKRCCKFSVSDTKSTQRVREPESQRAREPESQRAREPMSKRARELERQRIREPAIQRAREPESLP